MTSSLEVGCACRGGTGDRTVPRVFRHASNQPGRFMTRLFLSTVLACSLGWFWPLSVLEGQACDGVDRPTYSTIVDAIAGLGSTLDTLAIRGRRHVTIAVGPGEVRSVRLGLPSPRTTARASATCRMALVWSTRGDSLIAMWLATDQAVETIPDSVLVNLTLADQPRPIQHDVRPSLLQRTSRDRLVAQLFEEAGEPEYSRSAMVLSVIDTAGAVVMARLIKSSGVRELDEGILEIWRHLRYSPASFEGELVAVGFATPIAWPRR